MRDHLRGHRRFPVLSEYDHALTVSRRLRMELDTLDVGSSDRLADEIIRSLATGLFHGRKYSVIVIVVPLDALLMKRVHQNDLGRCQAGEPPFNSQTRNCRPLPVGIRWQRSVIRPGLRQRSFQARPLRVNSAVLPKFAEGGSQALSANITSSLVGERKFSRVTITAVGGHSKPESSGVSRHRTPSSICPGQNVWSSSAAPPAAGVTPSFGKMGLRWAGATAAKRTRKPAPTRRRASPLLRATCSDRAWARIHARSSR